MAATRARAKQVTYKSDATGATVRLLHDKLSETVSVKDFGAVGDGVTDDGSAVQTAIQAAASTGNTLVFPTGDYLITTAVSVTLTANQTVNIEGMGSTITVDDPTSWEQIQIKNETPSNGCSVSISDLTVIGSGTVAATHWGVATGVYKKNIGILIAAQNVHVSNVHFKSIWGKALNIGYFTDVYLADLTFRDVGGHSYTYTDDAFGNGDSFGDAIYLNSVSGDATINAHNIDATGMTSGAGAGGAGGGLSRAGFVIENDAADAVGITLNCSDLKFENYERTFHFENHVNLGFTINDVYTNNTAVMIHTYLATASGTINNMYYAGNQTVSFNGDVFFFQQVTASISNSEIYNPTKAWDTNTTNVPSGTNLTFNKCRLFYNDARHHGKNCSVVFNDCIITDYNDDASNATMSVSYNRCQFTTSIGATYENTLSASSGTETFYLCDFTNQYPSTAKNVQGGSLRFDQKGIANTNGVIITNVNNEFPKINRTVYRVTELDTNNVYMGYVNDVGTISALGATPAIQAGSTGSTLKVGGTVTLWAYVEILHTDTN